MFSILWGSWGRLVVCSPLPHCLWWSGWTHCRSLPNFPIFPSIGGSGAVDYASPVQARQSCCYAFPTFPIFPTIWEEIIEYLFSLKSRVAKNCFTRTPMVFLANALLCFTPLPLQVKYKSLARKYANKAHTGANAGTRTQNVAVGGLCFIQLDYTRIAGKPVAGIPLCSVARKSATFLYSIANST